jgi:hypothetical protein
MIRTMVALSIPLVLVAVSGPGLAQEQVETPAITGTVDSVDPTARSVVLDNGQTYMMGDSAELGSLQPGARVDLACDTNGANCTIVSSAAPKNARPESGTEPSAGRGQDDGGGSSGSGSGGSN